MSEKNSQSNWKSMQLIRSMTSLSFIQWIHKCVCGCKEKEKQKDADADENENEVDKKRQSKTHREKKPRQKAKATNILLNRIYQWVINNIVHMLDNLFICKSRFCDFVVDRHCMRLNWCVMAHHSNNDNNQLCNGATCSSLSSSSK